MKCEHDLAKFTKAEALLGYKDAKVDAFGKYDIFKKIVTLGCNHSHTPRSLHSVEIAYDTDNKLKGIYG